MVLMGAGSATHSGREGIWVYEVARRDFGQEPRPGRWAGDALRVAPQQSRRSLCVNFAYL